MNQNKQKVGHKFWPKQKPSHSTRIWKKTTQTQTMFFLNVEILVVSILEEFLQQICVFLHSGMVQLGSFFIWDFRGYRWPPGHCWKSKFFQTLFFPVMGIPTEYWLMSKIYSSSNSDDSMEVGSCKTIGSFRRQQGHFLMNHGYGRKGIYPYY